MELESSGISFEPPAPFPGRAGSWSPLRALRALRAMGSQIESLPRAVYEADAWRPPIPGMPLFVMSPDAIQAVLLDRADEFPQGDLFARMMRPAWGGGLLLSRGETWRVQRRAAAQAFRAGDMAALTPFFVKAAATALGRWRSLTDRRVDLFEEMKRITFDVMLDTMLSGERANDRDGLRETAHAFFADINHMRLSYLLRSDAYHARRREIASAHRAPLIEHIRQVIAERRAADARGDLVDLLMAARDPDSGEALSDEQLCDNLLGFLLAGYETTAVASSWTLYLLAVHAPTRERAVGEIANVVGGGPVQPDQLSGLVFLRQVVSESMRLYPPAFMVTRVSAKDTELAGERIRAGQRVNIPIYAIHRRKGVWPNPHAFEPERFAAGLPKPGRFSYMPFGGGPRICIGAAFAMAEIVAVLATLLPRIAVTLEAPDAVWPATGLALYPANGLPARVDVLG